MSENKFDMTSLVLDSIDKRLLDEYEYVLKDGKTMLVDPATSPFGEPVEPEGPISFTVPENTRANKELKSLISKAEGIDLPPSRSLLGIPIPTRDKLRSNITSLASSLGVPMGASQFISDLVAGPMGIDFGVADLTGFGELIDAVNGFSKMQSGLALDDPGTAVEGMVEGTFGGVGLKLLGNELFEKLKPKAKEALGFLAGKAREYKANQTPGTKLLSTDPTDPTVDAIIKLDEMVNKPQGPELTGSSGELGFYSKALEETKKLQQKKGTGQQFRQMLKKAGVSDDEIEWSGLETVLRKDKTTKKEIEDQLRLNKLEIREVVKDKLPEETMMRWDSAYSRSNDDPNYIKSADELKEGEDTTSQSAKVDAENLMTPEEVFGPYYIDGRADEILNDKELLDENYTIEQARADAFREFYDDPFIRIEDQNTGMVILGNDSTGYSIYKNMEDTKGEGAYKNAITDLQGNRLDIATLSEAKVQAQQFALDDELISMRDEGMVRFSDDLYRLAGGENYREFVITSDKYDDPYFTFKRDKPFQGDHYDEENIIGHFRTSDRTTMAGDKVLYIDEIQSDWGQTGRKDGFRPKDINDDKNILARKGMGFGYLVPRGPFVENTSKWTDLMVKRILAKAVEEGYDMVSFSPGYIQNMRWREPGLIKYYDDLLVKRVTKIVDKLDDTAYGAGNEEIGQLNKNRGSKSFGRINLDDTDFDKIEKRALNDTAKRSGEGKFFDFTKEQVFGPFTVRMTNKLKEGVKKGQSLFALPVVAGTTAMTMEDDDGSN